MDWHAIVLNNMAVIRTADHGISDLEWEIGARIIRCERNVHSRPELYELLVNIDKEVLNDDEWSEYMFNPEHISTDQYINNKPILDKWDAVRVIC